MKSRSRKLFHTVIAILCATVCITLFSPVSIVFAQQAESQVMTTTEQTPKLASGELDSLVAPIALYSDPLLAQTLAASTYPLEIIQLQQWMDRNKNLKGKALADAVAKQSWDPSVQGLVEFPDLVQRMAGNIQWTTDLGNAFLAQQSDVMDAVQRMRAKAQGTGNLKASVQQKVETQTVSSGKQVIAIEPASPDVVYVPSYDPTVVYGPPPPQYPYYPYTYPGYVPGTAFMWGAGIAVGAAAWGAWGGHWGNCDWNHGEVNINNNNNFNKNVNRNNANRGQAGQGNKWQHNPQHRGNAPYGDRNTANKFGGRSAGGAGDRGGAGGAGGAGRPGGAGGAGGVGKPGGAGGVGGAGKPGGAGGAGGVGKPGGAGGASRPGGGAGAGAHPGGGGGGAKPATRPAGGSAKNQVGNRSASSRPSSVSHGGGGFGGGASGNYARASSSRGGHSMGGGGFSGAGRGGGRGGGGGGRRR